MGNPKAPPIIELEPSCLRSVDGSSPACNASWYVILAVLALQDCLHALQIIIYDLDVIRPLTATILTLYVANSLQSLSFVLLPVKALHYDDILRSHDSNGMKRTDFPLRFCMQMGHFLSMMMMLQYMHNGYTAIS